MTCSILLLEPDDALAEMLSRFLSSRGHQVLRIASAETAVRQLTQVQLDLAIVDLLPSSEGWQRLWRFWRTHPLTRKLQPLLLAASPEEALLLRSYGPVLLKPLRLQDLEERVVSLHRGTGEAPPSGLAPLLNQLGIEAKTEVRLTFTEFQLLGHLMNQPEQTFSARRLLEEVWGYPQGVGSPELVRAHMSNLRRKLRQINPTLDQVIQTAPRQGYRLIPPPPQS